MKIHLAIANNFTNNDTKYQLLILQQMGLTAGTKTAIKALLKILAEGKS
jgi:hypothetical protein